MSDLYEALQPLLDDQKVPGQDQEGALQEEKERAVQLAIMGLPNVVCPPLARVLLLGWNCCHYICIAAHAMGTCNDSTIPGGQKTRLVIKNKAAAALLSLWPSLLCSSLVPSFLKLLLRSPYTNMTTSAPSRLHMLVEPAANAAFPYEPSLQIPIAIIWALFSSIGQMIFGQGTA